MGIFDFLTKPSDEKLTKKLVNYVYNSIQTDKGVRVEDALCVISTIVAAPKVIKAAVLPIHSQDSLSCQTSKKEAKLKANNGKKTLKPTDADKPTPRQILIMVSNVIIVPPLNPQRGLFVLVNNYLNLQNS